MKVLYFESFPLNLIGLFVYLQLMVGFKGTDDGISTLELVAMLV